MFVSQYTSSTEDCICSGMSRMTARNQLKEKRSRMQCYQVDVFIRFTYAAIIPVCYREMIIQHTTIWQLSPIENLNKNINGLFTQKDRSASIWSVYDDDAKTISKLYVWL